jgi:predicted nucleic acid-binding protein
MRADRPVVIDTNVIIDAFVRSGDARSRGSIELLRRIEDGQVRGVLPAPVLVEVSYIVLDITHDPGRASRTVHNLLSLPNISIQAVEREHALAAMEIIRETNYFRMGHGTKLGRRSEGLSMTDSLVLAIGASIPGAVVCSNEGLFARVRSVRTVRPWELVRFMEPDRSISDGRP